MNETKNRAMKAIGRYLELKGCEIVEEGWTHGDDKADYIIDDDGELAFAFGHVHENVGAGIPDEEQRARSSINRPRTANPPGLMAQTDLRSA